MEDCLLCGYSDDFKEIAASNFALLRFAADAAQRRALIVYAQQTRRLGGASPPGIPAAGNPSETQGGNREVVSKGRAERNRALTNRKRIAGVCHQGACANEHKALTANEGIRKSGNGAGKVDRGYLGRSCFVPCRRRIRWRAISFSPGDWHSHYLYDKTVPMDTPTAARGFFCRLNVVLQRAQTKATAGC